MKGNLRQYLFVPFCLLLCLPSLFAQDRTTAFPTHALGSNGRKLLEAVNSNAPSALADFFKSSASKNCLTTAPLESQVAYWKLVREQSGGFELTETRDLGGVLEIYLRTKHGGHPCRIYVFPDKGEPAKIYEAGITPVPGAEDEKALSFPVSPVQSSQIPEEIGRRVSYAASHDLLSGVVLVAHNDSVVFQQSVGFAEQSFHVPNTMRTRFNLASMNKMFTAIAIAQLVEAGKLRFTDTLINVLPDFPNPESARRITIAHLLSHTSGLRMLFDNQKFDKRMKFSSHMELVRVFGDAPPMFEPGSKWSYSNEGYVTLGAVIERITGTDYYSYVRTHIYEPAGMKETDSFRFDEVVPNIAMGYGRFEDDPLGINARRPNVLFQNWRGNACGGGYSTAPDLLKFAKALRSHVFLSPAMTDTITSPKFSKSYGYGFIIERPNGKLVIGHGGGGPNSGINSEMRTFKDGSWTVIVLSNYDASFASDLCDKIVDFLARQ